MSAGYKINKIGPKIEPWATPEHFDTFWHSHSITQISQFIANASGKPDQVCFR